jgi:hypothetical protein
LANGFSSNLKNGVYRMSTVAMASVEIASGRWRGISHGRPGSVRAVTEISGGGELTLPKIVA